MRRDLPRSRHHVYPNLRVVISLLWFSVPNSAEEHSRIAVDLDDATVGLGFLCAFLAYDHRKTLYLR